MRGEREFSQGDLSPFFEPHFKRRLQGGLQPSKKANSNIAIPAAEKGCECRNRKDYDFGFIVSLAADIISPEICRMCSPALVNWLRKNSDWICSAS